MNPWIKASARIMLQSLIQRYRKSYNAKEQCKLFSRIQRYAKRYELPVSGQFL